MEIPETTYAWNGDVALAYQVIGDGPIDLIYYQGLESNVDLNRDSPRMSHFLHGLAKHARVIITTPKHASYLRRMNERGERGLMFVHIPHVLVAGAIDVSGARVVPWDEPP